MNHKYSTIALIIILLLTGIIILVSALEVGDISDCIEGQKILTINGNWTCSTIHYAEGYFHNYDNPATVTISTNNTYYQITNYTIDNIQGINIAGTQANITKNSTYKITLEIAMQGGNNGDYEIELHKNNVAQIDCATFVTTTTGDHKNIMISCIKALLPNDKLDVRIKDVNNPAQNILYHQLNFNIIEIN